MTTETSPVLRHQNWRFLLRDFTRAHPEFVSLTAASLQRLLAIPASIAWWLSTFQPEMLERENLHIVLPGAGIHECADAGRWMSFVSWLAGQAPGSIRITLVGLQLATDAERRPMASDGLSRASLERCWATEAAHLVARRAPAEIFNGSLGAWRRSAAAAADVCLLFAPGFEEHGREWLTEDELVGLLRTGITTGILPYSDVDGSMDQHLLRAWNLLEAPVPMKKNPWHQPHPDVERTGALALYGWHFPPKQPLVLEWNEAVLDELAYVYGVLRPDFDRAGDAVVREIGTPGHLPDSAGGGLAYLLPEGYLVEKDTGVVLVAGMEGDFWPVDPDIVIPTEALANPPADGLDMFARWKWAVELFTEFVDPVVNADEDDEQEDFLIKMLYQGG